MYVYKPMSGHNLMQAIARVNRVFQDKEGGLVVDYVGIAAALKQAMNDYTARDKKNYGDTDVSKAAYPKFLEKLSVCRDFFYGYDYGKFLSGSDLEKAQAITGGVNFILGKSVAEHDLPKNERTQNVYIKEALLLRQALSLCGSLVNESARYEAAFFDAVRTMIVQLQSGGAGKKFTLPEVNERINELLKQSIKSEGVINLFSDVGTEFSLFDSKFLEEVANMKEKNLAVELLKKLIAEQVSIYRRTNLVKSEKFSEIIQSAMNRYLNVVRGVQLFPFQHCVRGNMNAEDRSLRLQSLWPRPWPHSPIFKFQRSQSEQQPGGLPPCPESPVKGPLAGSGMGFLQKSPEAVHGR